MIRTLHEGLLADGIKVPLAKLFAWFGLPRRTVHYRPITVMFEKEPSVGYRTVA